MRQSLYLGETPCEEPCEQVGPNYNPTRARLECVVLREQLIRLNPPPENTTGRYIIKSNPYNFGSYFSVEAEFDDKDQTAIDWAYEVESIFPEFWDEPAKQHLTSKLYTE